MDTVDGPDIRREKRVPPGQHLTKKWPVLHAGEIPDIELSEWRFKISGLVAEERTLTFQEFDALAKIKISSDIHCVTRWSRLDNVWEGVSTQTIKDLVRLDKRASFVLIHAAQGFTTNLSIEDFFQPDVLFALRHDGQPLTPDHGFPLRLVVPRLYFWKSAKWVEGIEFLAEEKLGYWESLGYHRRGDPWKEERYGKNTKTW